MDETDNFYTLKGYSMQENNQITSSMEDYLEMIYRLQLQERAVRINKLAACLHVKPSSASKMAGNLRDQDLIIFEKYGMITLTEKGLLLGEYLLSRHDILNEFFCLINHTEDELEQVEKVEHFLDRRTVANMQTFLRNFSCKETP